MSFGFGVGDFITILDKASKLKDRFADAPVQFKAISNEVSSLKDVLKDIHNLLTQHEPTTWQKKTLDSLIKETNEIIVAVGTLLDKNSSLDSTLGDKGNKPRKTWKRLNWDLKEGQELRARMSFNIELLSRLLENVTSNVILATKASVDRLHQRQDVRERDEEQTKILDYLSNIDFVSQQNHYMKQWQPGTGQWLLGSNHFQQWLETRGQVLFCPGIPGAGKTTLTAVVIEYLLEKYSGEPDVGIAYIYFNFRRKNEQKLSDSLASLLKQLSGMRSLIPGATKQLYNRNKLKKTRPSTNELLSVLENVTKSYERTFIIIDALDECEPSDGSRSQFIEYCLVLQAQCSVNLFMTSRFIHEIMRYFSSASTLEIRADPEDVRRFLSGQMNRLPRFVHQDIAIQEEIQQAIIEAVDGMFLLAQLYIDSLCGKRSRKAIRDALKKLRGGVEAYDFAYKEAMERIEGQLADEEELAKQVLAWIVCAKRPLTTGELQHALAVERGDSELCEDNISEVEDMVSVCAGLVAVDEQSSEIRLVHYTTQDYLRRTLAQWFPGAEHYITAICISYMSFKVFGNGSCTIRFELLGRVLVHKLYEYAAKNWGHHAHMALDMSHRSCDSYVGKQGPEEDLLIAKSETMRTIMEFLKKEQNLQAAIQVLFRIKYYVVVLTPPLAFPCGITALHMVTKLGILSATQVLLANDETDPNACDSYGRTPLHYAAKHGKTAVIQLLLENNDIDPNIHERHGFTPLAFAAELGHEAAVCALLANDQVNPNAQDNRGLTPLILAIDNGHEVIARFLFTNDRVDPMINSYDGQTALGHAVVSGMESLVRHFLDVGIFDPNAQDKRGFTPLLLAAEGRNKNMIQLLLANDKVNRYIENFDGLTLVFLAVMYGDKYLVQFVLDQGIFEPNVRNRKGQTPLSYAARWGRNSVVRHLLLNDKVDPNTRDNDGLTPFQYVDRYSKAMVQSFLATKRVHIDRKDFNRLMASDKLYWNRLPKTERCVVE